MPEQSADPQVLTKQDIRVRIKSRLKSLPGDERLARSALAAETLLKLIESEIEPGTLLAVFEATPEEITLASVRERLEKRHTLCFPKVEGGTLVFRACRASDLVPGYRAWLPEPPETAPLVHPQALVVPGRAFTGDGGRLGRGAGLYDRALSALPRSVRIGYCFDFQRLQSLPLDPHDERMTWLVTDEGPGRRCNA